MKKLIDKPIRWKFGDRVVRREDIHNPDSLLKHGTVIDQYLNSSLIFLYGVYWDHGEFDWGFFWYGLREEEVYEK